MRGPLWLLGVEGAGLGRVVLVCCGMERTHSGVGRIGVCSWSLCAAGAEAIARIVRDDLGLECVQLSLSAVRDEGWGVDRTRACMDKAGIEIISGMMASIGEDYSTIASIRRTGGFARDETWCENLGVAEELAEIARALNIGLVTMHAGSFVTGEGELDERMVDRVRAIAGVYAQRGVGVALETGHGLARDVLALIEAMGDVRVGVNFDPGNMLLYGAGDPAEALRMLLPHVVQCHVKDAIPSAVVGEWGTEVRAGSGVVDWGAFFGVLGSSGRAIDVVIERESGDARMGDIRAAVELVRYAMGGGGR